MNTDNTDSTVTVGPNGFDKTSYTADAANQVTFQLADNLDSAKINIKYLNTSGEKLEFEDYNTVELMRGELGTEVKTVGLKCVGEYVIGLFADEKNAGISGTTAGSIEVSSVPTP